MPPDHVTLAIHCALCHGTVTLQFEDWQPDSNVTDQEQAWLCPYCLQKNTGKFPALLRLVTKGHDAAPHA